MKPSRTETHCYCAAFLLVFLMTCFTVSFLEWKTTEATRQGHTLVAQGSVAGALEMTEEAE